MDQRPILTRLRKLIATRDLTEVEQAVEIAVSLDDPALFDALLQGVEYYEGHARGQPVGGLKPGGFFTAESRVGQRSADHALRLLLSRVPERYAPAKKIRDKVTFLTLHLDEPYPHLPLDLGPLAGFKNLQKVHLRGCSQIANLGVLGELPMLREVLLSNSSIAQGFENLGRSPSLQTLVVQGAIPRLGDLGECPTLRTINLNWNDALPDLHGIESLKGIEEFHLSGNRHIESLADFSKITTLKRLELNQFSHAGLTSLAGIERNRDLESLRVSAPVVNVDALRDLKRLRTVSFNSCRALTSVAALAGCRSLTSVDLSYSTVTSLDGLEDSDIEAVELSWCSALCDLRGMRGCTKIEGVNWARMTALRSLDGMQNLRKLSHLSLENVCALTSISALRDIASLRVVQLVKAHSLTSLDGLQGARDLESLTITYAETLKDVTALGAHPRLRQVVLTQASTLTDVTALAALVGLETLDLSHAKALTDVNALAALPNLKALGLGHSGVNRATLDAKLKKITTFASEPDLDALAARGPIERHGAQVPEAVKGDQKKNYQRLKKLLLARDTALVDQGIELAAALDEPGIFEGLLEGITYDRTLRRSRSGVAPPLVAGGMFVANQALTVTGPGAPFRDRAVLGLLARAPEDCAPAKALRAAVTALELDGEAGSGKTVAVDLSPLTVFPHLETLTLVTASSLENFERVAALKGLKHLACVYCGPSDLSVLQDHPGLTHFALQAHWRGSSQSLDGLGSMPALTSLVVTSGTQAGAFSMRGFPSLVSCEMRQIHQLDRLEFVQCPSLASLHLASLESLTELALVGCERLASLTLMYTPKLKTVRGLGELHHLTSLSFSNGAQVVLTRADAEGLSSLTHLHLTSCPTLTDLSVLEPLKSLEKLELNYCQNLADIKALATLPKLREVWLNGCSKVSDVATLEAIPSLAVLDVRRTLLDKKTLPPKLRRMAR